VGKIGVRNVVRKSRDTYAVTFNASSPNSIPLAGSRFVEGNASVEPPQQLAKGGSQFTVNWTPSNDTNQLVWEVKYPGNETARAETPRLREIRDQWTLSLDELKTKFAQNKPSGLTVRTGADAQRTMYLRGNDINGRFRIWQSGLVSYQTKNGWWEVTVDPEVLVPGSQKSSAVPVQASNQYTFSMTNSPYDGSQWMSTLLRKGSHWGVNVYYFFPYHGKGSPGLDPAQPDEVYSRISFRLSDSWSQSKKNATCKLYWAGANLSAGVAGKGGNQPTGDDGWSVRVYTESAPKKNQLTHEQHGHHVDQNEEFADLRQ
jgi:hypothetical protein